MVASIARSKSVTAVFELVRFIAFSFPPMGAFDPRHGTFWRRIDTRFAFPHTIAPCQGFRPCDALAYLRERPMRSR